MPIRNPSKLPALEKVLLGGCLMALATYWASETAFTISIISVTVLALVVLFMETTC